MEKEPFKDLFSKQSKKYALSRPTYPTALFEFISGLVDQKRLAWDCATGNGQAAVALSEYFEQVIASDMSAKQIENAQQRSNIVYQIFPAEKTPLKDDSVDLITIAQALHWFNFDDFYLEAKRVLRSDGKGIIAAWTYGLNSTSTAVDSVTYHLYKDILGKYWPVEIKHVANRYEDIPFPFEQIPAPQFQIELDWDLAELINYFYSWSSVQKFIDDNGHDPVREIQPSLEEAWGREDVQKKMKVTWPLYVKVGKSPS